MVPHTVLLWYISLCSPLPPVVSPQLTAGRPGPWLTSPRSHLVRTTTMEYHHTISPHYITTLYHHTILPTLVLVVLTPQPQLPLSVICLLCHLCLWYYKDMKELEDRKTERTTHTGSVRLASPVRPGRTLGGHQRCLSGRCRVEPLVYINRTGSSPPPPPPPHHFSHSIQGKPGPRVTLNLLKPFLWYLLY